MNPSLQRAGLWFVQSGIQETNGGIARYRRTDTGRNLPISTEITGYGASAFVYLYRRSGYERYLDHAVRAAEFLRQSWDPASGMMPFEVDPAEFSYFFDCGIIVRGLLAVWRETQDAALLETAVNVGRSMLRDFDAGEDFHPIVTIPGRVPEARDPLRWSRMPGCYQLKAALAWKDLADITGDAGFRSGYERMLEASLRTAESFLPGHPDELKVMDRLHAFSYFLEGLLPRAGDARVATALCHGIQQASGFLGAIAPRFDRSDVYAQLLRVRIYAAQAGAVPMSDGAGINEAMTLLEFQADGGGFWFGRKGGEWLPFSNPVSTAFGMQALDLWDLWGIGAELPPLSLLI